MSTIATKLFGKKPFYLNIKPVCNLFELLGTNSSLGTKVIPVQWQSASFPNCYYTISSISLNQNLKSGSAKGRLTWFAKESSDIAEIQDASKRIWKIYMHAGEESALAMKVHGAENKTL